MSYEEEDEERLKRRLYAQVSRDIEFMKQSLFSDSGRAARRARRKKQTWLKRLKLGGG